MAQNYYWEAAGYYWSIFKPSTANDDSFDLNKKCDNNESVAAITKVVNGGDKKLKERELAYQYYWGCLIIDLEKNEKEFNILIGRYCWIIDNFSLFLLQEHERNRNISLSWTTQEYLLNDDRYCIYILSTVIRN